MNTEVAEIPQHEGRVSLVQKIANQYSVDPDKMLATMKATCFKQAGKNEVTNEQMMSMLIVADQYQLNPFTRELYAFPQNGGIVPIVSIDGWIKIINSQEAYDGMELVDQFDDKGKVESVTCKMYRSDRSHPTIVTEHLTECYRNTDPWKKQPLRMLRHKATIQAARYSFGLAGVFDADVDQAPEPIIIKPNSDEGPLSQVMGEARSRQIRGQKLGPVEVDTTPAGPTFDELLGDLSEAISTDDINTVLSLATDISEEENKELLAAAAIARENLGLNDE